MYLLDTNVVSELRKTHNADPAVWAWAQNRPKNRFFLSVVTILEIEKGVLRLARKDLRQSALFSDWLRNIIMRQFEGRILPFDTSAALRCAALHIPDPKPERDGMIAATALAHGLAVVTRNIDDFSGCGIGLINPWLPAS